MSLSAVKDARDSSSGDGIAVVDRGGSFWVRLAIPSSAHSGTQEPTITRLEARCGRTKPRALTPRARHWDERARCLYLHVCPLPKPENSWNWWTGTLCLEIAGDQQAYDSELELRPQSWISIGDAVFVALVVVLVAFVGLDSAILDQRLDVFARTVLFVLTLLGVAETWSRFLSHVRRLYWPKLVVIGSMSVLVIGSATIDNRTNATLRLFGTDLPPGRTLWTLRFWTDPTGVKAEIVQEGRRADRGDPLYDIRPTIWPSLKVECETEHCLNCDGGGTSHASVPITAEDCRVGALAEATFAASDAGPEYRVLADAWLRGARPQPQSIALGNEIETAVLTWASKPEGAGLVRKVERRGGPKFWIPSGENSFELAHEHAKGELICAHAAAPGVDWLVTRAYTIAGSDPAGSRGFRGLRAYEVNYSTSRWIPHSPRADAYTCLPRNVSIANARIELLSSPPRQFRLRMSGDQLPMRLEIALPSARGILECQGAGKEVTVQPVWIDAAGEELPHTLSHHPSNGTEVGFTWSVLEGEMAPWSCRSTSERDDTLVAVKSNPNAALQYRAREDADVLEAVPGRVCYVSAAEHQPISHDECVRGKTLMSRVAMSVLGAKGCAAVYVCEPHAVQASRGAHDN